MYFDEVFAHIEGNTKLREPQIQAYLKVKEYFESATEPKPALVNLPTGVGKTGLMAILPYGIAEKRVLIVTPNKTIRNTVTDSLDPSVETNFWYNRKVIANPLNLPTVIEFEGDTRTLSLAKIVITNIHRLQASNENSLLNKVPADFFDLVIIDEAHHSPANTWIALEQYFSQAKFVKITGTPFRSDNKEIYADEVYSYPLSRAMLKGYVKQLVKRAYIPNELKFTVDNGQSELTLEEVMEIKETEWVERTVAYSTECSLAIVNRSVEIMQEKRSATGTPHKIIAVACSVEHAKEIKQLYESVGCPTSIVFSSMSEEDKERQKLDFQHDRTSVIVNVNMLGEGYDHNLISVAAIFRPFKSLSAYAQFAGRALRAIPNTNVPQIDNVAHLVYHSALGLEELWEYYSREQRKAEIIDHLGNIQFVEGDLEGSEPREVSPVDIGTVQQSATYSELNASYLGGVDVIKEYEEALEATKSQVASAVEALESTGIKATPELIKMLEGNTFEEVTKSKRPDLELNERKKELTSHIENEVAEILLEKGLNPKGEAGEIAGLLGYPRNNKWVLDGFCVFVLNDQLKRRLGLPRADWSISDYKIGRRLADEFLAYLKERI